MTDVASSEGIPLRTVDLESAEGQTLAKEFNFLTVPTVVVYKDGDVSAHSGPRTRGQIHKMLGV